MITDLDLRPVFDVLEPAGAEDQPGGFLDRRPQAVIVLLVMVEHPLDALAGFLDRLVRHAVADETHHFGIAVNSAKGMVGVGERPPAKEKTVCGENEHTFLPLDFLAYEESSQGHAPEEIGPRLLILPEPKGWIEMAVVGCSGYRQNRLGRRGFLEAALAGLTLPSLLQARAATGATGAAGRDTAVIQVWLGGAASHIETYDPKPAAPVEFRGPFQPIATNVPGIRICETLPQHARIMHKVALLRSVHHTHSDHQHAMHWCLTGHAPAENPFKRSSHPSTGSVAARVRRGGQSPSPPYVCMGYPLDEPAGVRMLPHRAAYWGSSYDPFEILNQRTGDGKDPGLDRDFHIHCLDLAVGLTPRTLTNRYTLLTRLDHLRRNADRSAESGAMDRFHREALDLLTGRRARQAFDLEREDLRTRQRYGLNRSGQTLLLARRLVEAGVSFVTVIDPGVGLSSSGWDLHTRLEWGMKTACPRMDTAVTALIEDLYQRGLDRQVLVVVWGEFGRTPRINKNGGRDHWPGVQSVLLSGGGFKMGQVIGSSTRNGEVPRDRPLWPEDLVATVYHHLGIQPHDSFPDQLGRPIPVLMRGQVIRELVG
ncbi:MAG TPA: DUF1501 domain-containing protein [Gemmataceae bacterium]|nr:DUF1501 domain-containing protein [Gemmataceae bacterium]